MNYIFPKKFAFISFFLFMGLMVIASATLLLSHQSSSSTKKVLGSSSGPYPQSTYINLSWSTTKIYSSDGDNWPITWMDNGNLFTSYQDGTGFGGPNLSQGFATVTGNDPNSLSFQRVVTNIDVPRAGHSGVDGHKTSGLLMVNGVLYAFVRNIKVNGDPKHAQLASSTDHGKTWTWASWVFSTTFGCPEFVQYGANYQGGDPTYVYIASQNNNDPYSRSPDIVMARVKISDLGSLLNNQNVLEYFSGTNSSPSWSQSINQRASIFHDINGTQRISITYNAPLQRYFLVTSHDDGSHSTHTPALGVFDSPNPWGPWTTDYYSNNWCSGECYHQKFPTKFMSSDGKTMWMLYSGQHGTPYSFDLKKATLTVSGTGGGTGSTPKLNLSMQLIGIGTQDNPSPLHTARQVSVTIYKKGDDPTQASVMPVTSVKGTLTYTTSNGLFTNAQFDVGTLPTGDYQILVKTDGYLRKRIIDAQGNFVFTLTDGQVTTLPTFSPIPGDVAPPFNQIDLIDYTALISCYGAKASTSSCNVGKQIVDLNDDGVIDGIDYNIWLIGKNTLVQNNNTAGTGDGPAGN